MRDEGVHNFSGSHILNGYHDCHATIDDAASRGTSSAESTGYGTEYRCCGVTAWSTRGEAAKWYRHAVHRMEIYLLDQFRIADWNFRAVVVFHARLSGDKSGAWLGGEDEEVSSDLVGYFETSVSSSCVDAVLPAWVACWGTVYQFCEYLFGQGVG